MAKESIFSGLNNLAVYTLLQEDLHTCFGFTESEVAGLFAKAGVPELLEPVRAYYNGYVFGGEAVYNPWSILHFVASSTKELVPYWVATSGNELVKELLLHHAFAVQEDMEALLARGSIEKKIDEDIVFPELRESPQALWNLDGKRVRVESADAAVSGGGEPTYWARETCTRSRPASRSTVTAHGRQHTAQSSTSMPVVSGST